MADWFMRPVEWVPQKPFFDGASGALVAVFHNPKVQGG